MKFDVWGAVAAQDCRDPKGLRNTPLASIDIIARTEPLLVFFGHAHPLTPGLFLAVAVLTFSF